MHILKTLKSNKLNGFSSLTFAATVAARNVKKLLIRMNGQVFIYLEKHLPNSCSFKKTVMIMANFLYSE